MKLTGNERSYLSRRDGLRLLGVAGLGAMFGTSRHALAQDKPVAASTVNLQGAGFYRSMIGQASVILLSDGGFPMDPTALFSEASVAEIEAVKKASFLSKPAVPGHVNALLVREGSNVILIDTGCGSLFGPTTGFVQKSLERAGTSAVEVTHVVITHAHPDHIGGLVNHEGKIAFPNAKIVVNRAEHEFWTAESPSLAKAKVPDGMKKSIIEGAKSALGIAKPKLELARPGDKVGAAITIVDAPGHTPGHIALAIESAGESMLYITDACHVPAIQLAHPDWHVSFDTEPTQAVETRKALFAKVVADRALIAGAHIPFPALGHLVGDGAAYRFVPSIWEW